MTVPLEAVYSGGKNRCEALGRGGRVIEKC